MTVADQKPGLFSAIGPGLLQETGTSPSGEATLTHIQRWMLRWAHYGALWMGLTQTVGEVAVERRRVHMFT